MSNKRKIMILQTRHIESISYLAAELVKSFPSDKYDVTLVYLESGKPTLMDECAKECIFLGLNKHDYNGLRLRALKKMRSFLSQNHFDVIIAHMYKPISLLMQLRGVVVSPLCIGVIHTFGEFDRIGRRLMMRLFLDERWKMVGVSAAVRDYLIASNCGLHSKNTLAINNAVDVSAIVTNAMSAQQARVALGLPSKGLFFGTVGRCVKGKRHIELIKGFHQFIGERKDTYLVIIGDGESYAELATYVNEHKLQHVVYLVGYVPQALHYLRALDVFVFPSESEGFGVALLEAMSLSLPCIVNDVEPLAGIVAECGTLVDGADVSSIADAMCYYFQLSESERREKGGEHYVRALRFYNIDQYRLAYSQLVENFYKKLPEVTSELSNRKNHNG